MPIDNNLQYLQSTKFIKSIFDIKQLPIDNIKELAFVGRSNCGKSSIINALTNKKNLAITSKTPGRTRAINYFEIVPNKYLVDLPGYGYAKVSTATKLAWSDLLEQYLQTRKSLIAIILIMDIRQIFKDEDKQMLLFAKYHNLPTKIVLNKSDKLSPNKIKPILQSSISTLKSIGLTSDIQIFSSINKTGVIELRNTVIEFLKS